MSKCVLFAYILSVDFHHVTRFVRARLYYNIRADRVFDRFDQLFPFSEVKYIHLAARNDECSLHLYRAMMVLSGRDTRVSSHNTPGVNKSLPRTNKCRATVSELSSSRHKKKEKKKINCKRASVISEKPDVFIFQNRSDEEKFLQVTNVVLFST